MAVSSRHAPSHRPQASCSSDAACFRMRSHSAAPPRDRDNGTADDMTLEEGFLLVWK